MILTRKAGAVATAALLALTVTACGNANANANSNNNGGENQAAPAQRVSPLDEFLEAVWGTNLSQEEQQRRIDEETLAREELIAECMTDAGFEYTPNPASGGTIIINDGNTWRPEDRDFVATYGYGGINWPGRDAMTEAAPVEQVDPNQELVQSLSDSERDAWQNQLWGPPFDATAEITTEDWLADRGCWGWAQQQIQGESTIDLFNSEEFAPLFEAINQMHDNLASDYRFAAIDAEWAACMAGAGFPNLERQNDAQSLFFDELSEFWTNWDWETQGDTAGTPELAAMQTRETEIALADLDCRVQVNYRERQTEILNQVETQFVTDNRAALEALRAAATQR